MEATIRNRLRLEALERQEENCKNEEELEEMVEALEKKF